MSCRVQVQGQHYNEESEGEHHEAQKDCNSKPDGISHIPNESAAEGLDVASQGFLNSVVSVDSINSCPCGMDDTWLSSEAYDPRSNHPKAVRVERSILGRKELSMKSASEFHSLSQACVSACVSALPCSS